jgi:hypothetical protein
VDGALYNGTCGREAITPSKITLSAIAGSETSECVIEFMESASLSKITSGAMASLGDKRASE